ncbi:non-specific serine/threonine protein kinase [Rhizobium aethiopicum]|uniref:Non-specific serine/threonine protein kinase n=1 Tax=Rhizobium aethiopicum TaxID=1138170 RepID=A0A1C3Y2B2_9HYPH|nr:winged helix-turn-helix domain-containing protein [Rhizobium aethiopicum]SCB58592.1 non-specific serine/threonine protein kinase [Rhizobium aethiopicum]
MGQIERSLFEFSGWELDLAKRELRALGAPVPLGSRAFDILEVLATASGEAVTKDDLMRRVWPGLVVEDNTIQVHISAIRKALGKDRDLLKTISGRGYRLIGQWKSDRPSAAAQIATTDTPSLETRPVSNIPALTSELVGRESALRRLLTLTSAYRVVTLTGPGGIGKTVLASELARHLLPQLGGDAIFVELVSLAEPGLVPTTVAQALDLKLQSDQISAEAVARAVGARRVLLVIDNCEHVIDAAAAMIDTILRICPNVTVIATSRESLRIEGEFAYRVPPLEVPDSGEAVSAAEHSAIQLFVARTRALQWDFEPDQQKLSTIADICRHLDGIPLAIELAAARAATLGIQQIAGRLDDRFVLLTGGRRTALPRHQTLRAALDWSYQLLPESERQLLCRLAVFSGGFTLDAAVAVSGEGDAETALAISNLVSKSLITFDGSENAPRWRLLETVRVYSLEKLGDGEDFRRTMCKVAKHFLKFFKPFSERRTLSAAIENITHYRREIDNLRAALRWALSEGGKGPLGAKLAAISSDFWTAISLVSEAGDWAERALARLGDENGSRTEMVLRCALGYALIYTQGMNPRGKEVLIGALHLARSLNDPDYRQRVTCGLWLFSARSARLEDALTFAQEYEATLDERDLHGRTTASWLVGIPQTYQARHREAGDRLSWAAANYPVEHRKTDLLRLEADVRTSSLSHNTVNLISRGQLEQAAETAEQAIDEARQTGQPFVLCVALAWSASFVALSLDDLDRAKAWGEELSRQASQHGLRPFKAVGTSVRGAIARRLRNASASVEDLRAGLAEMREASYLLFYPTFLCELAAALQALGRYDEALDELGKASVFARECGYLWMNPEILRRRGEVLRDLGSSAPATIDDLFLRAMSEASQQEAIYWELIAALSLVDFRKARQHDGDSKSVLFPIVQRFTEGLTNPILRRAKALIDSP